VAHVEDRCILPASEMLCDRAFRVRKRHFPATEIYEFGAEFYMFGM
jgi:hypothetical protein